MSGSNVEATYSALLRELRFPQVVIDAHEGADRLSRLLANCAFQPQLCCLESTGFVSRFADSDVKSGDTGFLQFGDATLHRRMLPS
jgi:hypothetical protein